MRFIFNMMRAIRHMMMCEERTDRQKDREKRDWRETQGKLMLIFASFTTTFRPGGRDSLCSQTDKKRKKTELNKINKDFKAVRVTDPAALKSTNSHRSPGKNMKRFTASHLQSWIFETVTLSPWWNVLEFFVDPYGMFNAFVYVFVFVVDVKWIHVFSGNQINV